MVSILIVLEGHVALSDLSRVMWKFFANIDPRRDIYFLEGKIGLDVTQKYPEEGYTQDWPQEIEMTEEIKSKVDKKWPRLFNEIS